MTRAGLVFLVSIAFGCTEESKRATTPPQGPQLQSRQEKSDMPTAIKSAKLPFAVAAAREKFLKADRAARNMAGPGWITPPGDTYRYVSWNSGTGGYLQKYSATWQKAGDQATGLDPKRPDHTIVVSTELYHEARQAYGFSLLATWEPEHGWGAFVNFRSHDSPVGLAESFSLTLSHPELLPKARGGKPASAIVLGSGQAQFATAQSDDRYLYHVSVSSRPLDAEGPLHRPQVDPIRRYLVQSDRDEIL